MCPTSRPETRVTYIDLEFDPGASGAVLLGDIASSLVTLDDLLRDLGSIAAYPSSAEFREIQIVAIEMRRPLTVKLSLLEVSNDAVLAFRDICRDVINFHERHERHATMSTEQREALPARQLASVTSALERCSLHNGQARITEQETQRILGHIAALHKAEIPLTRIVVHLE